jgi:hypothetical protein
MPIARAWKIRIREEAGISEAAICPMHIHHKLLEDRIWIEEDIEECGSMLVPLWKWS